jgi:hypothetical protein
VKLARPLPAGTPFTLRLVLSKFMGPTVKVGYTVAAR